MGFAFRTFLNGKIENGIEVPVLSEGRFIYQDKVLDLDTFVSEVLKGKKRSANIAYPRMVAMYMCRYMTDQSFPRIGLEFGGKDHTTVMHACNKIEEDLKKIPFKVKKTFYTIIDWLSIVPTCIVIAIFCFSYLFIITPVSGDSMYPNIKDGEYVLVQYNKKIEREDVVIIEVNKEDSVYEGETSFYIKRIIGLPGEKVRWENNILYIFVP